MPAIDLFLPKPLLRAVDPAAARFVNSLLLSFSLLSAAKQLTAR
jgi:hypothetical protein